MDTKSKGVVYDACEFEYLDIFCEYCKRLLLLHQDVNPYKNTSIYYQTQLADSCSGSQNITVEPRLEL